VAAAVAAWFAYQRRSAGAGPVILGLIAVGLAIYEGTNKDSLTLCPVNDAANALGIGCSRASPGIGIYAAGVGGALVAIGGFQMWRSNEVAVEEEVQDEAQPAAAGDLAERLRTLETLRAEGLVTEDEYATRRTTLLENI
jgi:hypothetical protein